MKGLIISNRTLKILASLCCSLLITACGYRIGSHSEPTAISVPFVIGDRKGVLTSALIEELSHSSLFQFEPGSSIQLVVDLESEDEEIGYQYRVDNETGERDDKFSAVENMSEVTLVGKVINRATGDLVLNRVQIAVSAPYDYVDNDSYSDLAYDVNGEQETTLRGSLGQLDAKQNSDVIAKSRLYKLGAKQLVQSLESSLLLKE